MTEVDGNLMLEILKQLQGDVAGIKSDVSELKLGQIRIREDIHSQSGHIISLEKSVLDLDARVSRIEKRLDLVDA